MQSTLSTPSTDRDLLNQSNKNSITVTIKVALSVPKQASHTAFTELVSFCSQIGLVRQPALRGE